MTSGSRLRRGGIAAALAATLAVALAVGFVTARASAAPELPPVTPEELVASVLDAEPVALAGTVAVDNRLGLPAVPGVPGEGLTDGTSTARVWSDGAGRGRLALPRPDGERTYVRDGTTVWAYDSADRTATRTPAGADRRPEPGQDPQAAAQGIVGKLRGTSAVRVDGTTDVAGRPAYTLVLAPQPGERTVLREVRVAVDAESRIPLELTVRGTGPDPVLRAGFDDVTFGPQDPSLFTFTPPPGATVEEKPAPEHRPRSGSAVKPRIVGDGWDAVAVGPLPRHAGDGVRKPDLSALGTPVSGPWGSGRAITTNAGSAILTDDGRFATGAVGTDVLGAALAR
ncbi:outer membrane lipoprotein carrier protein LolA [Pseudonocardia sp. C8]|uniref:LolA family protein n=1 Tax=Pseudonocardia sp. C8 TaxID=2762759 RepID=UPI0016425662|nr:outer membrane lipoprotein carrier protein LolA [Pseudonocardia sp. C8]MBC3192520.1 outer membrane lipoprotein carrier protein LolA [Pseudonocardia sp. C8]